MTEKEVSGNGWYLDLEASLGELSKWLATMRASEWTPTKSVKAHRALAEQLESVAELLDGQQWCYLEDEVDKDPPPQIGLDGRPIATSATIAGSYQGTILRLREIADTAKRIADEYPNSNAKPELKRAAGYFLHIWHEAGKDRPAIYDNGEAVLAFKSVLDTAKYVMDSSSVRGLIRIALKEFDPLFHPPGFDIDRFLVWRQ
jgi:hypothetical protein